MMAEFCNYRYLEVAAAFNCLFLAQGHELLGRTKMARQGLYNAAEALRSECGQ